MTIDDTKTYIPPLGSLTMPAILPDSAALMSSPPAVPISAGTSVGPLGTTDFSKMSVSNILPNLLSNMPIPQLTMPKLPMPDFSKFSFIPMNFNFSTSQYNFGTSYTDNFTRTTGTYLNLTSCGGSIKIDGYNSSKGLKLAQAALRKSNGKTHGGGNCATKVRESLQETGLYTGHTRSAADYIGVLNKPNSHFKQISTAGINIANLPAGCILVYGRGVGGYSSEHGHIEITTGDGRAASDFVQVENKKPTAIFVPV